MYLLCFLIRSMYRVARSRSWTVDSTCVWLGMYETARRIGHVPWPVYVCFAMFLDVCTCRDSRPVYDHLIAVTHRDHMTDPVVHPLPRVLGRPTHELRLSIHHPARALDCAGGHMSTNRSTGQTYLQKA